MAGLTIDDPVTLAQALASERIVPGDVLELSDGIYTGDYICNSKIQGNENYPITIRPRSPGRVTIDGSLLINGSWVHLYDMNFTDSRTDRKHISPGLQCSQVGFRVHGCIISDMHNSGISWMGGGVGEITESIFLNNGYLDAVGGGHAHSIYTHNGPGGARKISRCMMSDNLGEYTVQLYSPSNSLRDYTIDNNVFHGDAVHVGGGAGVYNLVYSKNILFKDWLQFYTSFGARITDNEFFDVGFTLYDVNDWTDLTESGNIFYPSIPVGADGRDGYSGTAYPQSKVWLNAFTNSARWLGNVIIYNRDSAANVAVDFSALLSAGSYRLRNSQNPDQTWDFDYMSGSVDVPTNWSGRNKVGLNWGGNTWPVFGSLVIERA